MKCWKTISSKQSVSSSVTLTEFYFFNIFLSVCGTQQFSDWHWVPDQGFFYSDVVCSPKYDFCSMCERDEVFPLGRRWSFLTCDRPGQSRWFSGSWFCHFTKYNMQLNQVPVYCQLNVELSYCLCEETSATLPVKTFFFFFNCHLMTNKFQSLLK